MKSLQLLAKGLVLPAHGQAEERGLEVTARLLRLVPVR